MSRAGNDVNGYVEDVLSLCLVAFGLGVKLTPVETDAVAALKDRYRPHFLKIFAADPDLLEDCQKRKYLMSHARKVGVAARTIVEAEGLESIDADVALAAAQEVEGEALERIRRLVSTPDFAARAQFCPTEKSKIARSGRAG